VDVETADIKTVIAVPIKENGRSIWKECLKIESHSCCINTEWPKKMYTLFTHQYLWNKFKWNFYFRV